MLFSAMRQRQAQTRAQGSFPLCSVAGMNCFCLGLWSFERSSQILIWLPPRALSRPAWTNRYRVGAASEKAMAPHSRTLAWKIPWMEEPGGLQSMGLLGVGHDFTFTFTFHFHALEKEMATHSSVLAWRIPGTGEPGGLLSMGLH